MVRQEAVVVVVASASWPQWDLQIHINVFFFLFSQIFFLFSVRISHEEEEKGRRDGGR